MKDISSVSVSPLKRNNTMKSRRVRARNILQALDESGCDNPNFTEENFFVKLRRRYPIGDSDSTQRVEPLRGSTSTPSGVEPPKDGSMASHQVHKCLDCGFISHSARERRKHCCCMRMDMFDETTDIDVDWLYEKRIDPWGRPFYLDVIDNGGDELLVVDGNGMTYGEPKKKCWQTVTFTFANCRSPFHCLSHFS